MKQDYVIPRSNVNSQNVICCHGFYVVIFPLFLAHFLSISSGLQYFLQYLKASADFTRLAKFKQERGGECSEQAFMQIGCGETLWSYNQQPKQTAGYYCQHIYIEIILNALFYDFFLWYICIFSSMIHLLHTMLWMNGNFYLICHQKVY